MNINRDIWSEMAAQIGKTPVASTPSRQQPTTGLFGIGKSNNIFGTPFTTSAQQNGQMPGVNTQYTTSGLMSNAQPQQQQARRSALDMLTNLRDQLQDGVTQPLPQPQQPQMPQQMPQQPQSQYPYVPQQQISMNPSNNVNPTMSFTNQNGTINVNPTISCSPQVSSNPQFGGMPQMAQTNGFDTSVVNQATPQMASNGMARQNVPTCEQQRHATQQRKQKQAPQQGANMFSTNGKGLFSSPDILKDKTVIEPKPEVMNACVNPSNITMGPGDIMRLLNGNVPPIEFTMEVINRFQKASYGQPAFYDDNGANAKMIICGSLFGNINTLSKVLSGRLPNILNGLGIVFLGNYTGFGNKGLNVILAVMLLKIGRPNSVICLRGKHECPNDYINLDKSHGFMDELKEAYGEKGPEVYNAIRNAYNSFQVFARIKDMLFCNGNMPHPSLLTTYGVIASQGPKLPYVPDPCVQSSIWNSHCLSGDVCLCTEYFFPIKEGQVVVVPSRIPFKCLKEFLAGFKATRMFVAGDNPNKGLSGDGEFCTITTSRHDGPIMLPDVCYLLCMSINNGRDIDTKIQVMGS